MNSNDFDNFVQHDSEMIELHIPDDLKNDIIYCRNVLKTYKRVLEMASTKYNSLQYPNHMIKEQLINDLQGEICSIKDDLKCLQNGLYSIVDIFNKVRQRNGKAISPESMHFYLLKQLMLYKEDHGLPIFPKKTPIYPNANELIAKYVDPIKEQNDEPEYILVCDSNEEEEMAQHTQNHGLHSTTWTSHIDAKEFQHVTVSTAEDKINNGVVNLHINSISRPEATSPMLRVNAKKHEELGQEQRRSKCKRKNSKRLEYGSHKNFDSDKENGLQLQAFQLVTSKNAGSNLQVSSKSKRKSLSPLARGNIDKHEELHQEQGRSKRQHKRKRINDYVYQENSDSEKKLQLQNFQLVNANAIDEGINNTTSNLRGSAKPIKVNSTTRRSTKTKKTTSPLPVENIDNPEGITQEKFLQRCGLLLVTELTTKTMRRSKRERKINTRYLQRSESDNGIYFNDEAPSTSRAAKRLTYSI